MMSFTSGRAKYIGMTLFRFKAVFKKVCSY